MATYLEIRSAFCPCTFRIFSFRLTRFFRFTRSSFLHFPEQNRLNSRYGWRGRDSGNRSFNKRVPRWCCGMWTSKYNSVQKVCQPRVSEGSNRTKKVTHVPGALRFIWEVQECYGLDTWVCCGLLMLRQSLQLLLGAEIELFRSAEDSKYTQK